jgi:hypothetical protein
MSPEMMKIVQDMADTNANASTEQLMKAQQKMATDMQAMLTQRCGTDPQKTQGQRFERLRQIEAEASDVAMPSGYKPPVGSDSGTRPFARGYGMLKERIPVFCATDKKASAPTQIAVGTEKMTVVKVQGQGGQEYVFRQDEVDALNAGCARVMGLMNSLFDIEIK